MGMTAAVAGGSGYAGGELLRLLADHPDLQIREVYGGPSSTGQLLGDVHPNLITLADLPLADPAGLATSTADIVFLALPHGASGPVAATAPAGTKIVDLGADHRLTDPAAWARGYGGTHAGAWTYGLPELPAARAAIRATGRVAAPGCYPTAVILGLHPLLAAGLIDETDIVVVASSGTSGAGRAPKTSLLGAEVMGDLTRIQGWQPSARPRDGAGARHRCSLVHPGARRRCRGACSRPARRPSGPASTPQALRAALAAAYADEPFVHVLAEGRWPHAAAVAGSNCAHLQVTVDAIHRPGRGGQRHRQPRQGRRRPGPAVRQPDARPAGNGRPRRRTGWRRERHRRRRLPGRRCRRRAEIHRRAGRRRRRQRRAPRYRRRGLHHQPGPGRAGALVPAGADLVRAAGRRAEFRRRQRLHGRRGLRRHPSDRGARGAAARDRRRGGCRLLHRPDRAAAADGQPAGRGGQGRRRPGRGGRPGCRRGDPDHGLGRENGRGHRPDGRRRLYRRRHDQGRGHARPEPGHDALRPHHRRRDRRRGPPIGPCVPPPGGRWTASTATVACPPTTPCCCWRAARSGTTPDDGDADRGRDRGLRRPGRADPRRRRGVDEDHRHRGGPGRERGRRRRGRPCRRPQQPAEVRALRRGPELGPGAGRGRHDVCGVRGGPARRRHQRRAGVPGRGRRRRPRPRRPVRPGDPDPGRSARRRADRDGLDERPDRRPTSTRTRRTRHDRGSQCEHAGPHGAGQDAGAHRGAALAGPVQRPDDGDQVRRPRDVRPRTAGGFRGGRGVPAVRRDQGRRRARRGAADHRPPGQARRRQFVRRRPAGHHRRDDGGRPDGAGRPGATGRSSA